jgi:hypothetical protein
MGKKGISLEERERNFRDERERERERWVPV